VQSVEVVRTVAGTPERAWTFYTDHAGWIDWAGVQHATLEVKGSPDPNGAGAVRCLGSYGLNAFEEILEFEPPKRLTYRLLKGGLPLKNHRGEVVFEPSENGTKVIWRCRFDSRIPGLGPLLRLFITRFFREALEGFARCHFPGSGP